MKKIYCINCEYFNDMGEDGYACEAPQNQIEVKSKDDNWMSPADFYMKRDKHPRDLNENNNCHYFMKRTSHT